MGTFIKTEFGAYTLQMQNFNSKIGSYKTTLDITTAELADCVADTAYLTWLKDNYTSILDYTQKWTAHKNLMRSGIGGAVANLPTALTLTAPPTLVNPNIQLRFSNLVARIKKHKNYTEVIGQDLGIVASSASFDAQAGKPVFTIQFTSGGHPNLIWKKGNYQGVEIWKDNGDGTGFKKLDKDFSPDFADKSALPAPGSSAVWKYKMIYIYNDEHAGQWSDEVSTTVIGVV